MAEYTLKEKVKKALRGRFKYLDSEILKEIEDIDKLRLMGQKNGITTEDIVFASGHE